MATVDKNFRIKNGLVVEGTTGTINGNNILTESAGDSYILNLVGGATLVKSVDSQYFTVNSSGYLTITDNVVTVDGTQTLTNKTLETPVIKGNIEFDTWGGSFEALAGLNGNTDFLIDADYNIVIAGSGQYLHNVQPGNQIATEGYVDNAVNNAISSSESYADTAANNALNGAKSYTDSSIAQEVSDRNAAIATAKSQAISTSNSYTDSAISTEVSNRNSAIAAQSAIDQAYTDTAKADAISTSEAYTDAAIASEVSRANAAYDPAGSAANAQSAAETFATNAANTAQSNAEAYADTVSTNAQNAAEAYADTVGANTLNSAKSYTDTKVAALVDSAPSILDTLNKIDQAINNDANFSSTILSDIATAQATAESYTDTAIANEVTARNSAIATAKADAISTSESYTDAQIAAGNATATPTYEALNVNAVSLIASAKVNVPTAGSATAYSWNASSYATAKALVKFSTATHTQVTEVLLTLDAANNIAITQYGEVGTNGELGTITANYAAGVVYITVTTNQSSTDVMTYATLIQ